MFVVFLHCVADRLGTLWDASLSLKHPANFSVQSVLIENSFSLSLENSLTLKFFKVKKHLQKHCTTNCKTNCKTRCRISIQNKICLVTCRFDFGHKFYRDLWSKFMIKLQSVDRSFSVLHSPVWSSMILYGPVQFNSLRFHYKVTLKTRLKG